MRIESSTVFRMTENSLRRGALRFRPVAEYLPSEELLTGKLRPSEPIAFSIAQGRKGGDFFGTTHVALYLISARFVECLRRNNFTGWRTYPVDIQSEIPAGVGDLALAGISALGTCGAIDESLSELVLVEPPVRGGLPMPYMRGAHFPADSWDGNDFFVPEGTLYTCVTSRVREAVLAEGLEGVEFTALPDLMWPST